MLYIFLLTKAGTYWTDLNWRTSLLALYVFYPLISVFTPFLLQNPDIIISYPITLQEFAVSISILTFHGNHIWHFHECSTYKCLHLSVINFFLLVVFLIDALRSSCLPVLFRLERVVPNSPAELFFTNLSNSIYILFNEKRILQYLKKLFKKCYSLIDLVLFLCKIK